MSTALQEDDILDISASRIVLSFPPAIDLSDRQFFDLCQANRELRIERNEHGELFIMAPAGGESSHKNGQITMQLFAWANRDRSGIAFDSSACFHLPNGSDRAPDASCIRLSRWNALSVEERKRFAPICPDFVVELRSDIDRLRTLQAKMREYIASGAELGLLVDPEKRQVHIYRRDREVEIVENPQAVSCEPQLPGFTLDLREIWQLPP